MICILLLKVQYPNGTSTWISDDAVKGHLKVISLLVVITMSIMYYDYLIHFNLNYVCGN